MSSVKARTALQHAVPGFVLVVIVFLVTICFNIVGAFACSILTGMILGASRQWKWYILPVSLVFPAATLGLLEFSKGDVLPGTRILLSVLCWAGFMVTFLLGYVVVYFEHRGPSASAQGSQPVESGEPASGTNAGTDPPAASPPCRLTLNILQGEWSCESLPLKGERQKRILQVAGDEVVLWITDGNGQVTCQAKGRLRLE